MTTDQVTIQVPAWLARSHKLVSRELIGTVKTETERGLLFVGSASIRETSHCLRCGRGIENPVSMQVGYGPDCSDMLGIPRDFTADQIDAIRARLTSDTEVEVWLPKSKVEYVDGSAPAPASPPPEPTTHITVDADRGAIEVRSAFQFKEHCKAVPGARWNKSRKVWEYPSSPATAAALQREFSELPTEFSPLFEELLDQSLAAQQASHHKSAEDLPDIPGSDPDRAAWLHQRQAFWFCRDLQAAMLAMDMGTGKSRVTVELLRSNKARSVLIVCPNNVQRVWPRELKRWGLDAEVFAFGTNNGSIATRTKKAAEKAKLAAASDRPFVLIINYEAVWRDSFAKWAKEIRWDYVVADESHRIKSPGSKVSKFMAQLTKRSHRRLALSGTPMANGPLDLYGQYRFLDPGIFGTNFARFRARYAVMGGYGGYEVIDWQRPEELNEKFHSIAYEVGAEVLDLPADHDIDRPVKLSAKAAKLYDTLTEQMIASDGDSVFTATNVLTRILRQQQLTGGSINDDDGRNVEVDDSKANALEELLSDLGADEPVVVFCRFTHDLRVVKRIAEKLGRRYGELSGRSKSALASDATMNPDVDIAGVQIQSGGVGIDLTRARYAVYYSLGHSLTDYLQSRRRVHRPGQDRPVTYFHLIAEGTVDESVYAALQAKEEVVDFIMHLHKLPQQEAV